MELSEDINNITFNEKHHYIAKSNRVLQLYCVSFRGVPTRPHIPTSHLHLGTLLPQTPVMGNLNDNRKSVHHKNNV